MTIQISEVVRTEHGTYVSAACGKVSAFVSVTSWGLQVCCKNASHRVWRGAGKHFHTLADALAGYRSQEMQAMIIAAEHEARNPRP